MAPGQTTESVTTPAGEVSDVQGDRQWLLRMRRTQTFSVTAAASLVTAE